MQGEQNPTERIKSSQAQLSTLRQKTPALTDKDLQPILQELTKNKISYAIFLYANEFMDTLITSETKIKFNILALCKIYATSCLYQLKPLKVTKYKLNNLEKMKEFQEASGIEKKKEFKISPREDQIAKFLESVAEAVRDETMKTIAEAIQKGFALKGLQMQKKQQFTPYEQFSINYLNYCLQQSRQKLQQKNICCKTIFLHQQHIPSGQGPSQQFKRYIWPINNASIKNHLTKTIVGFMNCKGGIIFIGIMENKEKRNQVVGINLKPTEVQPITDLFNNQLVGGIYPKHQGFNNQKKSGTTGGLIRNQYEINNFVKMEFTRVVDPNTFMNVEIKKDGKYEGSVYIVKIVVKIGHPKHLYHIINTQKNIDFFQRKDRNVQKMQFPDAYNMIYKRLDEFQVFKAKYRYEQETNKQKIQQLQQSQRQAQTQAQRQAEQIKIHQQSISTLNRQLFHSNCRYIMDNIQWLLKEDERDEEDEDDDDD